MAPTQGGHTVVVIDVNWRPVFWDDERAAKAAVLAYIQQAHVLKVTDEASVRQGVGPGMGCLAVVAGGRAAARVPGPAPFEPLHACPASLS